MEHVDEGKDVNVLKFPTPKWHEHDGGRYIGTGSGPRSLIKPFHPSSLGFL
jgi:DsbC/DsbD-like thiol-disulfide interchange protein